MAHPFEVTVARTVRRVTLVLCGQVRHVDAATAVRLCLAMPASVRFLEINAREVAELSEDARIVLLALVRTWRRVRHGHVSIQASERVLLAFGENAASGAASITPVPVAEPANPALTAMYL
jgi:hypothetical protein